MNKTILAVCMACALPALAGAQAPAPATPQGQEEMMKMMHLAANNQLGILEFCQAQGSVDADVVELQKRMLGMLPPVKVDGVAEAEAAGKRGEVQFGGNSVKLADSAKAQNTTPDAMCKQIGAMMKQQAAQLPK